jgi:hypothetical protein
MKQLTIDELSVGDMVILTPVKMEWTVTEEFIKHHQENPEALRFISRTPCTPENTKTGDWVYDSTVDVIHLFNGYHQHHFRPLKKEMACASGKPEAKPIIGSKEWAWVQMECGAYINHEVCRADLDFMRIENGKALSYKDGNVLDRYTKTKNEWMIYVHAYGWYVVSAEQRCPRDETRR